VRRFPIRKILIDGGAPTRVPGNEQTPLSFQARWRERAMETDSAPRSEQHDGAKTRHIRYLKSRGIGGERDMSNDRALAADYRKHAQELRHVAGEQRPVWANVALRKAADDYDDMAESLERIYAGTVG